MNENKNLNHGNGKRKSDGGFVSPCAYKKHTSSRSGHQWNVISELPIEKIELLDGNKDIDKRKPRICTACLKKLVPLKPIIVEEEEESFTVKDLLRNIKEAVQKDIKQLRKHKYSIEDFVRYRPEAWLRHRPKALVELVKEICGVPDSVSKANSLRVAYIIECLYRASKQRLILPISCMVSMLTQQLTRCKAVNKMLGMLSPGGSYTFITDWLYAATSLPMKFPSGDVKALFDNTQKIGKNHRLGPNQKRPTSTITVHAHIRAGMKNLQRCRKRKPGKWLKLNASTVEDEYSQFHDQIYELVRDDIIQERIKHLTESPVDINAKVTEKKKLATMKYCLSEGCNYENDPSFQYCRECRSKDFGKKQFTTDDVKEETILGNCFKRIPSTGANKADLVIGDPDMHNPNSYRNVLKSLRNLGSRSGISFYGTGNREWLFLEVDGTIYEKVIELIKHGICCLKCNRSFYGLKRYKAHICKGKQLHYEFDWVIPLIGLLHLEMNASKAFMEMNWKVFGEEIASQLNFDTDKALNYIQSCKDHHKTWSFMEMLFFAGLDEILTLYMANNSQPTVDGFWKWVKFEEHNDNTRYFMSMILTSLFSLMLLRMSVRRNYYHGVFAAMEKLKTLFYVRNHPIYQKLLHYQRLVLLQMPDDVKETLLPVFCSSMTGKVDSCQGGDACLEEVNKRIKFWLGNVGVPSEESWIESIRGLETMEKIRDNVFDLMSITRESDNATPYTHSMPNKDIAWMRVVLRESQFLSADKLTSMRKEELDGDLLLLHDIAQKNISKFQRNLKVKDGEKAKEEDMEKLTYAFVTPLERKASEKTKSLKKNELKAKITALLEETQDNVKKTEYAKGVKKMKKQELVDFLEDLRKKWPTTNG